MKFGLSTFPTHFSADPVEVAQEAEKLGFESFFVSEHTHIPVDTDFPLGDEVPMGYRSMYDPFVTLGAVASTTTTIRLGTAICIVPQHNAINLAKAIATLDRLSGGRVIIGVGAGWNPPEMANHGVQFEDRFRVTRETLEAMRELWTKEEAEYNGKHVKVSRSWMWPKPVQKPHPPILISGAGPNVLKRAVTLGDGWLPVFALEWHESLAGRMSPLDQLPAMWDEIHRHEEAHGKSGTTITAMGVPALPQFIDHLAEHGVERMILNIGHTSREEAFRDLESHAKAIEPYLD